MQELALQYEPREAFVPFHQRSQRFGLMVCHRRAGKTVSCINELVLRASYTSKKKAKYAYVGPFRKQARDVAWEYLKEATEGIRKGPPRESDLQVRLHNDAVISIYGLITPTPSVDSTLTESSSMSLAICDLPCGERSFCQPFLTDAVGQYLSERRRGKTTSIK